MRSFGSMPCSLCLHSPLHESRSQGRAACIRLAAVARAARPLAVSAPLCFIGPASFSWSRGLSPALGRSRAGIGALVNQVHSRQECRVLFGSLSSVKPFRRSPFECGRADGSKGLIKNANASFQVKVPASFVARWPGYSGGSCQGVPSAG